jgi:hypothetical protein
MTIRESIQTQIAESIRSKEAQTRRFTWNSPPSKQKEIERLREILDVDLFQVIHTQSKERNDS